MPTRLGRPSQLAGASLGAALVIGTACAAIVSGDAAPAAAVVAPGQEAAPLRRRDENAGPTRGENEILITASPDIIFPLAAAVERWPELLPHYRWVRVLDRRDGRSLVSMAAQLVERA